MNVLRGRLITHIAIFLVAVLAVGPEAVAATETIHRFDAKIALRADGSLSVVEEIDYDFSTNDKHGILRNIPLTAKNGPRLQISIVSVKDPAGADYEYKITSNGDTLQMRIGSANVIVTGTKSYILTYEVRNVIRSFEDHDELYWNVTGNEWPVAIENASVAVTLPPAAIPGAKAGCYTGRLGSTEGACSAMVDAAGASVKTTGSLGEREGLTLVLGFPKGHVTGLAVAEAPTPRRRREPSDISFTPAPVSPDQNRENLMLSGVGVVVLGVASAFFLFVFGSVFSSRSLRKKPKPVIPYDLRNRPIVVEYRPPDDLTPIEVGTIADRRMDITDVSSVIVDLAVRGYLKIRQTVKPRLLLPDPKDYEIERVKSGSDLDHPADEIVFDMLFKGGREQLSLSDLKTGQGATLTQLKFLKATVEKRLYEKGYFDQKAEKRYKLLFGMAPVVLFAGLILALWGMSGTSLPPKAYATVVASFVLLMLVLIVVRARHALVLTEKGKAALAKILGFREFLRLTEKDKLGPNAPELRPEMFEAFLPYAMVLGIEEQWTEKFDGIYEARPEWYVDPDMSTFNSTMLTRQVMTFGRSFHDTLRVVQPPASPRSTGVFSSGFSSGGFGGGGHSGGGGGGGFSGGGSGGGGGGSW